MNKKKSIPKNRGSRPRGKGGYQSRPKEVDERRDAPDSRDERLKGLNDFEWYNRNPELTYAASRIPFPYRPGMTVPTGNVYSFDNSGNVKDISTTEYDVPGVLVLDWVPTVSRSISVTDPASIVGKELYARVRKVFSGSIDADAPDFVVYLLSLDSIFSYIGSLKRVYRILDSYTPFNYLLPDKLLINLGYSEQAIEDLKQHKMELYQSINQLVHMTEKFKCPKVFDYFNRHYWMNDNVYCDVASPNSQMYIFNQVGFYKFAMIDVPGVTPSVSAGGCTCVGISIPDTDVVSYLFNYGRNLVNALASSDDAYLISGYLMRAFEGETEFRVDLLGLDEKFEPVYVPEVLSQIENSTTLYHYHPSANITTEILANNEVAQNPSENTILCTPTLSMTNANLRTYKVNPMISIRNDMPSEQDVVIATRLKAILDYNPTAGMSVITGSIVCGTEIPIQWHTRVFGASSLTYRLQQVYLLSDTETFDTSKARALRAMIRITNYDWAPFVLWLGMSSSNSMYIETNFMGDTHNVSSMDIKTLENLHLICIYSEFNSFGI